MKKTLLFLLVFVSFHVKAQTHLIGITSGISYSSIGSNATFKDPAFRTGLQASVSYEYLFKNNFCIGADVQFSRNGFQQEYLFSDLLMNPLGVAKTDVYLDYIAVPIKAGYYLGNRVFGFGYLSLVPSFLMNAQITTPIRSLAGDILEPEPIDATQKFSNFNLSGRAEIGGGYKITQRFWLSAHVAFQQSFTPTKDGSLFYETTFRQYGFNFSIGARYVLN